MIKILWACAAVAMMGMASLVQGQTKEQPMRVYIGTSGKGIYVAQMEAGQLSTPKLAAETKGAGYVWIHPSGKTLLATGQVAVDGKMQGGVRAFAIETGTGNLVELNAQSSGGQGPCYVATDRAGRFALAANYGSGSVSVLPVRADGKLEPASAVVQHEGKGPNPKRQEGPHAHNFDFDPDERFALACDLGIDQVKIYRFAHQAGTLAEVAPAKVAPGAGPRHIAFSKEGEFLYVLNEMGCTVTVFAYDAQTAATREVQTVPMLPPDYSQSDKDTGSEIFVHPTGKWVYASNRGHDSIVRFVVDAGTGKLSDPDWTPSGGTVPRYFGIDPTGKWMVVANQGNGNLLTFAIDPADGTLEPTGSVVEVGAPTCVKFMVEP